MKHMNINPSISHLVDMSADAVRAALLTSESYFELEVPKYINFEPMLAKISKVLSVAPLYTVMKSKP